MKFALFAAWAALSATLGIATVQDALDQPTIQEWQLSEVWPQPTSQHESPGAALTAHITYHRVETIAADGSTTVAVPKWDTNDGILDHVTVAGKVRFIPPSWYTGSKEHGAAFDVEDTTNNSQSAWCTWGYSACPPGAGENEGDPGGPWQKGHFKLGGVTHVAPRIETGLVYVPDAWDPFGGSTTEIHGEDATDTDQEVYTTDLDRWEGTGDWTWTLEGTYGGNNTCSSSGASFIGGWEAELTLDFTYSYWP